MPSKSCAKLRKMCNIRKFLAEKVLLFAFIFQNICKYPQKSNFAQGYKEMVATKKFVDMLTSDPNDVRNNETIVRYTSDADMGWHEL